MRNPEVIQEVLIEMEKRQLAAEVERGREAILKNSAAIFNSTRQVTLGNPEGDVTLVEFFDYNCGFCRKALADKIELMKVDPKLRIVLKEFPVLGEGSTAAAQIAVSVRQQDKTGGKNYFEFHQKLFATRGQIDKARALAVVREIGLDAGRAERDMQGAGGARDHRGGPQARRGARHQRHAELCRRQRRHHRRGGRPEAAGGHQQCALRTGDLLTVGPGDARSRLPLCA